MTVRRSFKRLVRARMARTNESYTTARRHVLAQASLNTVTSATYPGLLPGYRGFGGGQHHASAALAHALDAVGVRAPHTNEPYTEAMLAGLAGGIGFMYAVFSYAGELPTMTIVARHHPEPFVPAALRRIGTPAESLRTSSARTAERNLRAALAAGKPALCTVDRAGLPWHGLACGERYADPYDVLVCGLDDEGGEERVLLDDESVRPWSLPLPEFLAAWAAHRRGRHAMLAVVAPEQPVDLAAAVRDAVATTCAHLAGPVLGNTFDVNFGFSGMRRLAEQLADPCGKTGWAVRFADPRALFAGVRRLHDCLEVEYTGPGATRPLYADFLAEAAGVVDDPAYLEAADLFRRSGDVWSALAAAALPAELPALAAYDAMVEERLGLLLDGGAAEEIRAVTSRVDELTDAYAAAPPGEAVLRELLDRLAGLVEQATDLERRAVDVLTG
ncbi:DUF4872 domain-containing protein [Actinopolymorpha sp. B9G3]|uniref:BtrH N-terminal domain-containing protein n=1 Tax=Actinopolymorpha sp. B9G3 TaxID=3158970 RepID=UPI0032D994AE